MKALDKEKIGRRRPRTNGRGMNRLQALKNDRSEPEQSERSTSALGFSKTKPEVLSDQDDGVAEALRRNAELRANPASGISWSELKRHLRR